LLAGEERHGGQQLRSFSLGDVQQRKEMRSISRRKIALEEFVSSSFGSLMEEE